MTETTARRQAIEDRRARLSPEQQVALATRLRARPDEGSPGPRRRTEGEAPLLSSTQERLWFMDQLEPGSAAYNEYVALRFRGAFPVEVFARALGAVLARHEACRTGFAADGGRPVVQVHHTARVELPVVDLRRLPPEAREEAAATVIEQAARAPFALATPPLYRASLVRLADDVTLFVLVNHHIVGDGWSRAVVLGELAAAFDALVAGRPLPFGDEPLGMSDVAAWDRARVSDDAIARDLEFWRDALDGAPADAGLPCDRPRPATPSRCGDRVPIDLDAALVDALRRMAREQRATTFATLLAGIAVWLGRYAGRTDVVVGMPLAGRADPLVQGVVGPLMRSLPVRVDFSGAPTFADVVARAGHAVQQVLGHDGLPFERLVEALEPERRLDTSPIYDVLVSYQDFELPAMAFGDLEVSIEPVSNGTARFDLSIDLAEVGGQLRGTCEYNTDVLDRESIEAMVASLGWLLGRAADDPAVPVAQLLSPSPREQAQLDAWNDTASSLDGVPDLSAGFLRQVHETPAAVAVVDRAGSWTYADVAARVDAIALELLARGVRPNDRVGICLERRVELVASMLAVHAVGAAYVPLDHTYPSERLAFMVADAGVRVACVDAATAPLLGPTDAAPLDVDRVVVDGRPAPRASITDETAAYVIYTSGSTGTPKGVVVSHGNLRNFVLAMDAEVPHEDPITWLAVTGISFDISVLELLWPLGRGDRIVLQESWLGPSATSVRRRPTEVSLFFFAASEAADASYPFLLDCARVADAHGLAAVWTPERHFHEFGGPFPSPAVLGAALAGQTERLQIRAGSVVLPLHDPIRVAEDWAVVDNLSGGRVGISFAAGWHPDDFVLANRAGADAGFAAAVEEVRTLWRGGDVARERSDGSRLSVRTLPRPVQAELPVWITSSGSLATFELAGRTGANLLTHLVGQTIDELAVKVAAYRDARRAAGFAGDGHVTLMVHTFLAADVAEARDAARGPLREYLRSSLGLIERLAAATGATADDLTEDDLEALLDHATQRYLDGGSLIGTVASVQPLVTELGAAGVDELACLVDFGIDRRRVEAALPPLAELLAADQAAPDDTASLIEDHGVTHLQCTPSLARVLATDARVRDALAQLRCILLGGEALTAELVDDLASCTGAELHNMYGPTETTIWSTSTHVRSGEQITVGRPIANTTVAVLDEEGRLLPPGAVGELVIGGHGVATGYHDRPELDADRFRVEAGERCYRTGDLARWRHDGVLQLLGRRDHQVKVRGHRVELGEVEAALLQDPDVGAAAVVARDLESARAHLVAFVVPSSGDLDVDLVRARLADRVPGALVPSRLVALDALPLNRNGKVDRGALARLEVTVPGDPEVASAPPSTPTEQQLVELWSELLERPSLGVTDDFFAVGGHSLLAAQLVARVRAAFGCELGLRTLFDHPTVRELALAVDRAASTSPALPVAVVPTAGAGEPFELTDVQQAYWIGRQGEFEHGDVACHMYVEVDVAAPLDPAALEAQWQAMVERHDMLRAVVQDDGRQRIEPVVPPYRVACDDLRDLAAEARTGALEDTRGRMSHQVHPADRWPLFELRLSQLSAEETRVHLSIDTLIADGRSVQLLLTELSVRMTAPDLPFRPFEVSFRDHVEAERARRAGPAHQVALDYWMARIDALPGAPELPTARSSVSGPTRFVRREARLDAVRWDALKQLGAARRLTPSGLLLAAFTHALRRWSEAEAFVVALTLFDRMGGHPDLLELIGDFTQLSLFEVEVGAGTFVSHAEQVQARLWADLDHKDVSGVRVLREVARRRGVQGSLLTSVVFTSELGIASPLEALELDLPIRPVFTVTQTPQVRLDHQVREERGELVLTWDAVDAAFPAGLLDEMFTHYVDHLTALAAGPAAWERAGGQPAPLAPARVAANATDAPIEPRRLHDRFVEVSAHTPGATAVVADDGRVTYGELEAASRRVAALLAAQGQGPGDVVGVMLPKGWRQIAAAVGVCRAGAAYLPLAPDLPERRLAYMAEQAAASIVLVVDAAAEHPTLPGVRYLDLPADDGPVPPAPPCGATVDDLAYVIYTSGSTGVPKGVMIDHRAAWNTIDDLLQRFQVGPGDTFLGISKLSFDLSVFDIFGALAAGATLVLPSDDDEREPKAWLELLRDEGVTIWSSVPALMEMLLAELREGDADALGSLRLVMLSGDWVPVHLPDAVRGCSPAEVVSLGGATEASIWSIAHPVDVVEPGSASIPYGRPLANQRMHVLDGDLRPVPTWVAGDLYIGGVGLARGYVGAPDLTMAAFLELPGTGERVYRTGDRARYRDDGVLEFLGRVDTQVKLRGHRVELGEIEAVLREDPEVHEAVVVVAAAPASPQLVAYVTTERSAQVVTGPAARRLDPAALAALEQRLALVGMPRRDDGPRVALDPLVADGGPGSRRSARRFGAGPVRLSALAEVLQGLRRHDVEGMPRFDYPSAGGLYPVQTYVAVRPGGVEGLAGGSWYLSAASGELVQLSDRWTLTADLVAENNRELVDGAAFAVFLVAAPSAMEATYGDLTERFCLVEAGHMAQLLVDRAAAADVGLCEVGSLAFEPIEQTLSLQPGQHLVLALVGGPPEGGSSSGPSSSLVGRALDRCRERLPKHMVPRAVEVVDALPLSSNGKVDRGELVRRSTGPASTPPPAPAVIEASPAPTDIAGRLRRIWCDILGVDEVGMDDNFLDQGADSVHLVRARRRITGELGVELAILDLFEHPTLRALEVLLTRPAAPGPEVDLGDGEVDARRTSRARRRSARLGDDQGGGRS